MVVFTVVLVKRCNSCVMACWFESILIRPFDAEFTGSHGFLRLFPKWEKLMEFYIDLLRTAPSSTPRSMSPLPPSSILLYRELLKLWWLGSERWKSPPKRPTDVGENHRAPQDCRRACLILKTGGWRAETPAAAAACSSSDFRGKRSREIL